MESSCSCNTHTHTLNRIEVDFIPTVQRIVCCLKTFLKTFNLILSDLRQVDDLECKFTWALVIVRSSKHRTPLCLLVKCRAAGGG